MWGAQVYLATVDRPGPRPTVKLGVYGAGDSEKEKEPHQWRLLCFERATGKILWNKPGHEAVPSQERHLKATHCNSTLATDGQCIVAIFGSEGLFCFEMDGTPRWRVALGKMDAGPWDAPQLQWSFASSPLLHDGKVIVQCDVLSEQYLAVFDARDGRELWRTKRQEVANWCTPAVAVVDGRTQIVVNGWKQIGGYDFASGKQLWTLSGGGDIPVPAPLVVDDWVFLTSAHGTYRPLRAIRLGAAQGDISPPAVGDTNAAVAWCHAKLGSYMQTPIVVGDLLWSCDWQGILTCVDRATGKSTTANGCSGPARRSRRRASPRRDISISRTRPAKCSACRPARSFPSLRPTRSAPRASPRRRSRMGRFIFGRRRSCWRWAGGEPCAVVDVPTARCSDRPGMALGLGVTQDDLPSALRFQCG
ncbi:MAG: PQQ-binding-like beta-propeller repeat protein [Verrucomicrobia bacterium]|nr:PQQ-binding-like beta-propeller repeat protein [Verrucomicrobiota bacterium]